MKKRETMRRKANLLLFATSFLGGLATCIILSSQKDKQGRSWMARIPAVHRWANLLYIADEQQDKPKLFRFKNNVQLGMQKHIPDLYKATKHIPLSEKDILSE